MHVRAVVLDMDGTLILGNSHSEAFTALPGAAELLQLLRRRGVPFRVFTNGTAKLPEVLAASLRGAGLDIEDLEVMTPASAAAVWFTDRRIHRIRAVGLEGVQEPLRRAGLEVIGPAENSAGIEAVFSGQFREFTFAHLETAYRDIAAGAAFTTASNVPFFATRGGRAIGISFAINAMLRALTGKRATVLGKPSPAALVCALRLMGLPRAAAKQTLVIGDDPVLEMSMARRAGAIAVAVTSGLLSPDQWTHVHGTERPDAVLTGFASLMEALES